MMVEPSTWIIAAGSMGGSALGAYTAVRVAIATLTQKVLNLTEEVTRLRAWKHLVVDPYVPRAIDEHERRLNDLQRKVFNGP